MSVFCLFSPIPTTQMAHPSKLFLNYITGGFWMDVLHNMSNTERDRVADGMYISEIILPKS